MVSDLLARNNIGSVCVCGIGDQGNGNRRRLSETQKSKNKKIDWGLSLVVTTICNVFLPKLANERRA